MTETDDIPDPIKRQVRRASHFGCVVCGLPVYHYDHVEEHSVVKGHEASNLVLLCPNHHQDKTSGRLSKAVVRQAASKPHNAQQDTTASHRWLMVGDNCVLTVGGNTYEFSFKQNNGRFDAIRIQNQTVVGITKEDGYLLLDILLTDQQGKPILDIRKGEMVVSTGVWDYRLEGKTLTIRSGQRQIELLMTIEENGVNIERGLFVRPPWGLVIEPNHHTILPNRITMSGCTARQCTVGLQVG